MRTTSQGSEISASGSISAGSTIAADGIIAMAILGGVAKSGGRGSVYQFNKEARIAAEALGFKKINETIHGGQPVYKNGTLYITRDLYGIIEALGRWPLPLRTLEGRGRAAELLTQI